jgi:hypothetical protein
MSDTKTPGTIGMLSDLLNKLYESYNSDNDAAQRINNWCVRQANDGIEKAQNRNQKNQQVPRRQKAPLSG